MLFQSRLSLFDKLTEDSKVDIQTGAIIPIAREERVVYTMRIKMLKRVPGSLNGITIQNFEEGVEYDLPKELVDAFILKGYAENLEAGPMEQKVIVANEFKAAELAERTVADLKDIAKSLMIADYSKLNKEDLINTILVCSEVTRREA